MADKTIAEMSFEEAMLALEQVYRPWKRARFRWSSLSRFMNAGRP